MNIITTKQLRWKYLLIIAVSIIVVYGQTLKFNFVNYDDDELIYHNEKFLSDWSSIATSFTSHAFIGAGGESVYYRPIHLLTLITDHHIWQLNPLGYHLTNLLLHLMMVYFVFLFLELLLNNQLTAFFSALIFALHPVQTESVGWIAGRNDILLGLFIVLMMITHAKSSRDEANRLHRYLTIIFFTLALFTKESAAFYLLLIPVYDIILGGKNLKDIFSKKYFNQLLPFGVILVLYFIIRLNIFNALIGAEQMYGKNKPFIDRILNVPGIITEYIQLVIAPFNLSVAHPLSDVIWLQQPLYVLSLIIVGLFFYLIWSTRKRYPVLCYGLICLFVGLLPAMNLIPMPKPIFEHRLYVPMIGVVLATGSGVDFIQFKVGKLKEIIFIAIIILLSVLSFSRLPIWKDAATLFTDAVEKSPTDLHSNYSLARAYYDIGNYDKCIRILDKYLTLAPEDPRGYRFLREVYYVTGQREKVVTLCKKMIVLQPRNPQRYLETGVIFEELNQLDSAAAYYRQGILLDPMMADLHFRLGVVLEHSHQPIGAEEAYNRAVVLKIQDYDAYFRLAKLYIGKDDIKSAIQILEAGLPIGKAPKEFVQLLDNLYNNSNETTKSLELRKKFQF